MTINHSSSDVQGPIPKIEPSLDQIVSTYPSTWIKLVDRRTVLSPYVFPSTWIKIIDIIDHLKTTQKYPCRPHGTAVPRLFALQDAPRLQERAGVAPEAAPGEDSEAG